MTCVISLLHPSRSRDIYPCYQLSIVWCYYCMASYVFQAFASRSLSPESHTSPAHTRHLWLCGQRRRACCWQQFLEAVYKDTLVCSVFSPVDRRYRSTVLLIRSFSHQLSSEPIIICHKWELSTSASDLISFSGLCAFLCISRYVGEVGGGGACPHS